MKLRLLKNLELEGLEWFALVGDEKFAGKGAFDGTPAERFFR